MQHSSQRRRWAKIWIILTFLLVTVGNIFFGIFATDRLNTFGVAEGMTFGCVLWSAVLLGAMWMRHGWARYVLAVLICVSIVGFGAMIMVLRSESVTPLPRSTNSVAGGIFFYVLALVPLGTSHDLRHFLGPRTGSR